MATEEYLRLELLFKRAQSLPPLSDTIVQIIRLIDSGEASNNDLERVITGDPALAANFIRTSSSAAYFIGNETPTTVRSAIMIMGQRAVRATAVSLALSDILRQSGYTKTLDPVRFTRHSISTALLARYLFARQMRMKPFETAWTADEIFAAGLLHEISLNLLSRVAPDTFNRTFAMAQRQGYSLCQAFQKLYGEYPTKLGAIAVEAWSFPELFQATQGFLYAPWEHETEFTALCCLNYANYLSESFSYAVAPWPIQQKVEPDVEAEVGISDEEKATLMNIATTQVESFVQSMQGTSSTTKQPLLH